MFSLKSSARTIKQLGSSAVPQQYQVSSFALSISIPVIARCPHSLSHVAIGVLYLKKLKHYGKYNV